MSRYPLILAIQRAARPRIPFSSLRFGAFSRSAFTFPDSHPATAFVRAADPPAPGLASAPASSSARTMSVCGSPVVDGGQLFVATRSHAYSLRLPE